MATDQLKDREIHDEKQRVPQLRTQFEAKAKGTMPEKTERIEEEEGDKPEKSHELGAQFESCADKVRDHYRETHTALEKEQNGSPQNQPSLEEISNYRATAQAKSNEAIRAAKERNDIANKEAETGLGLETVKETLASAAKTAKDYAVPIAEKAKDYTVSTGQTTAHYIGEKAVAAKDAAIQGGKVGAEYAGKAGQDLKDKAVVAGWSTAHYSCDTAVEGTKAAARLVKGAAETAGKPLSAARDVSESTGESVKEYTARKKEEAQRESMHKQGERESYKESVKERGGGKRIDDADDGGGILEAIGETLQEIAQTTKEIVIGGGGDDDDETDKGQGYEKEHYQTATKKEHIA